MCFYSIQRTLIGLADSPVELVDSVDFLAQWTSEVSWEIICYVMTIIFNLHVLTFVLGALLKELSHVIFSYFGHIQNYL